MEFACQQSGPRGLTSVGNVSALLAAQTGMDHMNTLSQVDYGIVFDTVDVGSDQLRYNTSNGAWCPTRGTYMVNYTVGVTGAADDKTFVTKLVDTGGNEIRLGGAVGTGSTYYGINAQSIITQTGTTCYSVQATLVDGTQSIDTSTTDALTILGGPNSRFDVWRIA